MSDSVLEEIEDGVGVITLNRPDKANAMHAEMLAALGEAVMRMRDDAAVRCIVLTGAGKAFTAGGDIGAVLEEAKADAVLHPSLRTRPQTANAKVERVLGLHDTAIALHAMPKPTIAMINGACAGAGFALAGACDLRTAASSAIFTTAFARARVSGDYGGSYFWTRIAGTARARELYLLSEKFDAARALDWGLVNKVHPDADLRAETLKLARGLADGPAHAYALIKRNLNLAEHATMEDALRMEAIGMVLSGYENMERNRLAKEAERFADQIKDA